MAKAKVTIREPRWKGGLGAFKAVLRGIDFSLVKALEDISRREVAILRAKWPIGPERGRPHSITLFRVQRRRRTVTVSNAAPYAHFIVSPRTIGSADSALRDMVSSISHDFEKYLKGTKFNAN